MRAAPVPPRYDPPVRKALKLLTLFALSLLAFLPGIGRRDVVTSHEARVAQTARQMAATGWPWQHPRVDVPQVALVKTADNITRLEPQWDKPLIAVNPWLVPVLNGEIRLQKPPLPYWCAAALFKLAGARDYEALSRLTPALLGAIATFLIHGLALRLFGRLTAWAAALVWVSTYFTTEQFRLAMADPYLAFFTLLALWAWVEAAAGPKHRTAQLTVFYVAVALGLLAKGPPLFLVLGVPLVLFELLIRKSQPRAAAPGLPRIIGHLIGLALLLALTLPWLLYVLRHVPNVIAMWKYESVGELTGENVEKTRAFWFYLPALFYIALPWVAFWILGVAWPWIRSRRPTRFRRLLFPVAWYLVVVLLFTFSGVKKNTYLLPAAAASTLIIAQPLAAGLALLRRRDKSAFTLAWAHAIVGVGAAIAVIVLVLLRVTTDKPMAILTAALTLAAAAGAVAELRAKNPTAWLWRQAVTYALALITILAFLRPDLDRARSARAFCAQALAESERTATPLAVHRIPEEASLYLPLDVAQPITAPGAYLVIVDDPRNNTSPETRDKFADRAPHHTITDITRVPLDASPPNARWKLFRLTVN